MIINRKAFILPYVLIYSTLIFNLFYMLVNFTAIEDRLTIEIETGIKQELLAYDQQIEIIDFIKAGLNSKEKTIENNKITLKKVSGTPSSNIKIATITIFNLTNSLQTTFIIHYDLNTNRILYWIKTG